MIALTLTLSILALLGSHYSICYEFNRERGEIIRAILPFTIILGHVSLLCGTQLSDFNWIGMFAVGIFFFISGYGLEHKRQNGDICLRGLETRLRKLLFPLIIPCIVYIAVLYCCGENSKQIIIRNIKDYCFILPFTWFVIVLCFMYIIFYITAHYIKGQKAFFVTTALLIVLFSIINTSIFHIAYISLCNLAFPAGILYKQHEAKIIKSLSLRTVIAIIVMINTLALISKHLHNYFIPVEILMWTVFAIVLYSMINLNSNKFTHFLSNISYEVYLCQGITFAILGQGAESHNILFHIIFAFILTSIIASACHIMSQYLTKLIFRR